MSVKRGGSAFLISVILHVGAALVLGVYLVTQTEAFKDLIGAEVVEVKEPPKPKVRKPIIKPVIKPSIPTENTVVVEQVQVQPRPCLFQTLWTGVPTLRHKALPAPTKHNVCRVQQFGPLP